MWPAFSLPPLMSTFATANAILLAWFGITIASLFCVFADDDGGKRPVSWRGITKPCLQPWRVTYPFIRFPTRKAKLNAICCYSNLFTDNVCDEDTYVVVRSCQVKPTRILAGHRHQNGVCSHGEANDLLPELEEALYNIQFEQQWLQDENNRQPVVGIYETTCHNLLAHDQCVVVAVEYDRRQFYGRGCRLQNPRKICRTKKAPKATKDAENAKCETYSKITGCLDQATVEIRIGFSIRMELSTIAQLTKTSNNKILEAKGNAIQANMNLKDLDYFNPKLQIGTAYRISIFICEATRNYQQTLENKTSLRFRKYTTFDTIPETMFPNHYFEFISYNQLESKLPKPDENNEMHYPVLTNYIGCVRSVGDISINIIDTDYQLVATPATYYYLNPKIPEAEGSRALYKFKGYIIDSYAIAPLTFFKPAADRITEHYCLNLVEKYKPVDPAKVPPKVLAIEGKSCVFQFHFNTVGNMTDLTLDDVFDITNGNESTSSSSHKTIPETPPSSPTATTHPANKEDQGHRAISQSAKRALFQQPSTETKKPKD
ncbi:hypothetical protein Tco_1399785 [Tanacetum coccineum]